MAPPLRHLITLACCAAAAKKPPPKRVALVSFAAPWDYGPYAHQLRELAEHWLSTHHVVWIGLSGTVDRIQYGAPKISPLVGYRGAGMSKDPVKKVSTPRALHTPHAIDATPHAIDATRLHQRRRWVVFLSIPSAFRARRDRRAGQESFEAQQNLRKGA